MGGNYRQGLYNDYEKLLEKVDSLTADNLRQSKEYETKLKETEKRLKSEILVKEKTFREDLQKAAMRISELENENNLLREDNERLKRILNNNSTNSSLPPSTDQKSQQNQKAVKKANQYNGREKSSRKQGGQKGHKGKTLSKETILERIENGEVEHKIVEIGNKTDKYVSKFLVDIEIKTVVTEYRFYKGSEIPCEFYSDVQYGNTVKSLAADLYVEGIVSYNRIQDFISEISGQTIHISRGSLARFMDELGKKITPYINTIENNILNSSKAYTDATTVRCNKKNVYIRNYSTKNTVLYSVMEKKNLATLRKERILSCYAGDLIHDHETALYHFGSKHGECNVHGGRYLTKNTEESGSKWSQAMTSFLFGMNEYRKKCIASGMVKFDPDDISVYRERYDKIIESGFIENKQTKGKYAKKAELALLKRLKKYKDNHLLFLDDFDVAFDNNMSERDLRFFKTKTKVSGCFRSLEGCNTFAKVASFIQTCKRQLLKPYECLSLVLNDSPVKI